jgi:serine phosphatase RsbU (regulator of sigma subunit)
MEKGDALLLYTDGMFEATDSKGREFGMERLKKAFFAVRERPADEIVRNLADRVKDFLKGVAPEDDRTVVVVKRAGSAKVADTQPLAQV